MATLGSAVAKVAQTRSYSAGIQALSGAAHGGENLQKTLSLWKRSTILGLGLVAVCSVYNFLLHKEHEKHHHRPDFVPYSYLAIRKKKFPWGDGNHSLFHNTRTNALPEGYET